MRTDTFSQSYDRARIHYISNPSPGRYRSSAITNTLGGLGLLETLGVFTFTVGEDGPRLYLLFYFYDHQNPADAVEQKIYHLEAIMQ